MSAGGADGSVSGGEARHAQEILVKQMKFEEIRPEDSVSAVRDRYRDAEEGEARDRVGKLAFEADSCNVLRNVRRRSKRMVRNLLNEYEESMGKASKEVGKAGKAKHGRGPSGEMAVVRKRGTGEISLRRRVSFG